MKNKIFRNLTRQIPMNIQMYAENSVNGTGITQEGTTGGQEGTENPVDEEQGKPSYEELLEKLARSETRATQAEADVERWKAANDKLSSEAANFKKQLTEKMTAEEQLDAAKKEAEAEKNKRLEEVEGELSVIKAAKRYMTLKMDEKTAEEMAKLEISGDMENVIKNLSKHIEGIEKVAAENAINKFLDSRPDIKAGNGDAEKNSVAKEKAVFIAKRNPGANQDILNHYISGGRK